LYQKFWEEEITRRTTEPYALKEFRNRWYVLAKDIKDGQIKSFALDRLTNLEITKKSFEYPKTFDIEENYRYCFGIISPNGEKPKDIILSFDPFQGKYIKSLPLHETQQVLIDNQDELQIKLKLCVTFDLIMELLSFGDNMKVIKPKSLVKKIKEAHQRAFKQY
jgi:predicted DNA-binding transcriptional regulator YafY